MPIRIFITVITAKLITTSTGDFPASVPKINCPVYFFVGRNDHQTNYAISEAYYKKLIVPKKELFWFEKSGHLIPSRSPC